MLFQVFNGGLLLKYIKRQLLYFLPQFDLHLTHRYAILFHFGSGLNFREVLVLLPDMLPDEVDDVVDGKDTDDVVGILI